MAQTIADFDGDLAKQRGCVQQGVPVFPELTSGIGPFQSPPKGGGDVFPKFLAIGSRPDRPVVIEFEVPDQHGVQIEQSHGVVKIVRTPSRKLRIYRLTNLTKNGGIRLFPMKTRPTSNGGGRRVGLQSYGRLHLGGPPAPVIDGQLEYVSPHSFRAGHQCPTLTSGQMAAFEHRLPVGRVVWTRISSEEHYIPEA
jgi:hypothetical protein